jgi:hypothetical protein
MTDLVRVKLDRLDHGDVHKPGIVVKHLALGGVKFVSGTLVHRAFLGLVDVPSLQCRGGRSTYIARLFALFTTKTVVPSIHDSVQRGSTANGALNEPPHGFFDHVFTAGAPFTGRRRVPGTHDGRLAR